MLLSWLIALQQIFFLHSNHFEQISQIQTSISCFKIGDEDDVDGPMNDEGKSSWLSVKIRAIHKVNSTMSSSVSPSFSHQRHPILFVPVRKRFCDIIQSEYLKFEVKS